MQNNSLESNGIRVSVTVENLAPNAGTFVTPVWVGFHNGQFDLYNRGEAATAGLERLAEDGNANVLSEEFTSSGFGAVDGVVIGTEGLAGPIDPGEVAESTFTLDPNADNSQFFSYASMILPSNDAFIANGNPTIHSLFDENGNFIGVDFIVAGSEVLDAGTEVNDELAETTAFFSQSEADTGEDENGVVELHPGFIEGGRILSEDSSTDGAPAAFTNANFTVDGYQVVRITVAQVGEELIGTRNNETIAGGLGEDILRGRAGDDILIGDLGDDRLLGGKGNDTLMGAQGDDTLRGSSGNDIFVLGNGDGRDIITDFNPDEDKIGLVSGELSFDDLTLRQQGGSVRLGVAETREILAIVRGTDVARLDADAFVVIEDVSGVAGSELV